jgi:hypothetical protein
MRDFPADGARGPLSWMYGLGACGLAWAHSVHGHATALSPVQHYLAGSPLLRRPMGSAYCL